MLLINSFTHHDLHRNKFKRQRGQRGRQKIPASGHLAPIVELKNGRFYPRIPNLDEQERQYRLHDQPEITPHWFIWLYQWKEKDHDDFWKTRSKRVSASLIHSVKYMISAEKPIWEILNFIEQNKSQRRKTNGKRHSAKVESQRKKQKDKSRSP